MKKIYLVPTEDTLKIYSAKKLSSGIPDTSGSLKLALTLTGRPAGFTTAAIKQKNFDLDVLSVLFKYRPAVNGFPNQFSTSVLNGAFYLGYRTDIFDIKYKSTPFHVLRREITHYGISFGLFTGLGASRIDEYVTLNNVNIEYDGFVNLSGIAAIVSINKLSFGITGGVDHLLDKNKKYWIYRGKPWVGLSVGLNLN